MIGRAGAGKVKYGKKLIGMLGSEMPWTVSLAVSGITLQGYGSYMLVKTNKNSVVKSLPFLKYESEH